MKKILITFIVIVISFIFIPFGYSANLAKNICEYVAVDDKGRLRKLLKSNRLKLRTVFNDIRCDSHNILIFAAQKNAIAIGELLIKKLPKSVVENELMILTDISPELTEAAKARIN
jgi:hypothetical protein